MSSSASKDASVGDPVGRGREEQDQHVLKADDEGSKCTDGIDKIILIFLQPR